MNPPTAKKLDSTLSAWRTGFAAACRQVDKHRILGFPPSALPNRSTLLVATLASLGSKAKLIGEIEPSLAELTAKGVIDPRIELTQLDSGALAAIATACPYLRQVQDLVESMTARALSTDIGRTNEQSPVLRAPVAMRAGRGQLVQIEVVCLATARLLIHSSGLDETRVVIQPETHMMISMTHAPGELTIYAENDAGMTKMVCPLELGVPPQNAPRRSSFARAPQRIRPQATADYLGAMA